ncbi:MAG: flagellar basal body L-ring protein FlgH [Bdellovibrionia bacterium]
MYKKVGETGIILVILLTCGCSKFFADLRTGLTDSEVTENSDDQDKGRNRKRVTREDFIDHSQEEGSLWASSGQTNYYFTKNKVRSAGDIVTVKIENDLYRGINAEIKKSLSPDEKMNELMEAKELLREKLLKLTDTTGTSKDRLSTSAASPEKPGESPPADAGSAASGTKVPVVLTAAEAEKQLMQLSMSELDISPNLEIKNGDMMMGEIVGRYPNGNYKIRASKRVLYKKGQARDVVLYAIVKAADLIEDTDVVNSGKLYDYQVEVAH